MYREEGCFCPAAIELVRLIGGERELNGLCGLSRLLLDRGFEFDF